MKKCLIIIILMLIMLPIVYGGVTCEVSDDNATWTNVSTTLYDGCVDDTNDIASIQNLYSDTEYFIRCKDDTSSWGYLSTTTESGGGVDKMEIAAILGLGFTAFFFLAFAFYLGKEHFFLKMMLVFFALYTIILMPNVLVTGYLGSASTWLKIPLWFFRIFVTYFSVYLFWHWIQKSEAFMGMFTKVKNKIAKR